MLLTGIVSRISDPIFRHLFRRPAAERDRPHAPRFAPAIETSGLVKTFGANRAVDGIDLTVRRGAIYGLLGPNGAGKTTIVRMLATLLRPTAVRRAVLGHDVVAEADAVRRRISLTGQFASVDEDLTGHENLVLLGRLLGFAAARRRRGRTSCSRPSISREAPHRQVKTYSGGMRRRLDIAASLIVTPDLLFLDEPTTGLDPRSRNQVWDIIRMLVRRHHRAAHHPVSRGGRPARRPHRGHRPRQGDRRGHQRRAEGVGRHRRAARAPRRGRATASGRRSCSRARFAEAVHPDADPRALTCRSPIRRCAAAGLADLARGAASRIADFSLGQPSLDEVFFALTGHARAATNGAGATSTELPQGGGE